MSTVENAWISDWTAEEPIQIGYVAVGRDEGTWEQGLRPYLQYRDLGVAGVSDGKIGVKHIRTTSAEPVSSDWHVHDLDFQFFYVLQGEITIENRHGESVTLGPGDTGNESSIAKQKPFAQTHPTSGTPRNGEEAADSMAGSVGTGGTTLVPARNPAGRPLTRN